MCSILSNDRKDEEKLNKQTKKKCLQILIRYIILIVVLLTMIITEVEANSTHRSSFSYGSRQAVYILSKVMRFYQLESFPPQIIHFL